MKFIHCHYSIIQTMLHSSVPLFMYHSIVNTNQTFLLQESFIFIYCIFNRVNRFCFAAIWNTAVFVSSDPSQYLLAFECYSLILDGRYCGSGDLVVTLLVKK